MNKNLPILALAALAGLLGGCAASTTPQYDARFGDAVRQSRLAQTLNPAGSTQIPVGMDGKAAKEALGRYQESFRTPPPVVNVINIGGAIGGGQ